MRIADYVVAPGRAAHIARHGVSVRETGEVVFSRNYVRRAREGRREVIGQTDAGRYLMVIVAPRGNDVFALVTARDATLGERRLYTRHIRR